MLASEQQHDPAGCVRACVPRLTCSSPTGRHGLRQSGAGGGREGAGENGQPHRSGVL